MQYIKNGIVLYTNFHTVCRFTTLQYKFQLFQVFLIQLINI